MTITTKRDVRDDTIITTVTTVTETDRIVDYDDILESVSVEYDEWFNEAPWEHCDGFEHEYEDIGYYNHDGITNSRGCGWSNRERFIITISDKQLEEWGTYDYYRANGCSKQVAREIVAQVKRNTLDQLVKWYSNGWEWYTVHGDYLGYQASVGGVDSYEYAETLRYEIADEIGDEMLKDDYVIHNRHHTNDRTKLQYAKYSFKRNLQLDVVK